MIKPSTMFEYLATTSAAAEAAAEGEGVAGAKGDGEEGLGNRLLESRRHDQLRFGTRRRKRLTHFGVGLSRCQLGARLLQQAGYV